MYIRRDGENINTAERKPKLRKYKRLDFFVCINSINGNFSSIKPVIKEAFPQDYRADSWQSSSVNVNV